jgi:hypothetical protein
MNPDGLVWARISVPPDIPVYWLARYHHISFYNEDFSYLISKLPLEILGITSGNITL